MLKKITICIAVLSIMLCTSAGTKNAPKTNEKCLIPYYTGKVMPTPHKVTYRDKFMTLMNVGVIPGKGVAPDDPRLKILLKRFKNYDVTYAITNKAEGVFDSFVCVGDGDACNKLSSKQPPERPEAFLMQEGNANGKPVMILKGHDFHGLLWAITAFNQLVTKQNGKPVVQMANIEDYPDVAGKRGYTPMNGKKGAVLTKMAVELLRPNIVIYRKGRGFINRNARGLWRQKVSVPFWKTQIKEAADFLNPLNIRWYDSILPLSGYKTELQVRCKNEDDFQTLHSLAKYCAENGGNFCVLHDDYRFPMHPNDVKDFGSAREADIYLLNRLYDSISKEHPKFHLLFCPPFYWGPLSDSSAVYGENRDKYLSEIGKRFRPGIEIYWTGPRVKSSYVTKADMNWITDLISRKPVYWCNVDSINHGGQYVNYGHETINCWKDWFYPGFFNDLDFFTFNRPGLIGNLKLFDALWNRDDYNPEKSAKEAIGKMFGPKLAPIFQEFCTILEAMDHYGWRPNSAAAKNIKDVEQKTKKLEELYAKMLAIDASAVSVYSKCGYYLSRRKSYLKHLKANPNLKELVKVDENIKADAANDMGQDLKECIILTPNSFRCKLPPRFYAWKGSRRRFSMWLYGAKTGFNTMTANFDLTRPPVGNFEVTLCGLDHNKKPPCRMRVIINGKTAYEGENPFKQRQWTHHTYTFPGKLFHDNVNSISIQNIEDSANNSGAPFVMINYVVIRELTK